MLSIASLKKGQKAIIKDFSVDLIPLKLLEMGCLPGNEVSLIQEAPFKDPLYLTVNGSHLAIRKEMASKIEIELING
ncbi:MAG: FeoA family protein [Flavobacteriaceae bacterium]|nr:ferrous iron transport protein A [Flavobacteriaceae bacterium]MDG1327586.1 FeoA family protein [Flavobacteriaceae bacterium]MDG2447275.1 FeoA family protein [Flavobacteriaceae bacterium]|tara:strand:+ start:530 stop:760 length:231 start_codon:yes stop_codon:yes gene_type:complete